MSTFRCSNRALELLACLSRPTETLAAMPNSCLLGSPCRLLPDRYTSFTPGRRIERFGAPAPLAIRRNASDCQLAQRQGRIFACRLGDATVAVVLAYRAPRPRVVSPRPEAVCARASRRRPRPSQKPQSFQLRSTDASRPREIEMLSFFSKPPRLRTFVGSLPLNGPRPRRLIASMCAAISTSS